MSLDTGKLKGKLCAVTGSASSIGLDIAKRFCEYGAKVYMMDVSPDIGETARKLRNEGFDATGVALDVTDRNGVIACFDEIVEKNGAVYALVNSAGVCEVGPFETMSPDVWQKVFNINLFGTVNCILGAIRGMREAGEGRIVNLSSKTGKTGSKLMTVYGASKSAVISITQSLAQEYAGYGVHVNCVCPDIIQDTGMWNNTVMANYARDYHMSMEEVTELYRNKVPLSKFAAKEDVTDVVSFLVISADDCTGQSINITGGRFMH